MKLDDYIKEVSNNQPTFNLIALIGIAITIATFAINSAGNYAKLESRLAVMEYQLVQINEKARVNQKTLQRLDDEKR